MRVSFAEQLRQQSSIAGVGLSSRDVGERFGNEGFTPKGLTPEEAEALPNVRAVRVDEHYLSTMGVKLVAGRDFDGRASDSAAFIVNEAAVKTFKLGDGAVGTQATALVNGVPGQVVGVVEDFHFASLHQDVEPLLLHYSPAQAGNLHIRFVPGQEATGLQALKDELRAFAPEALADYTFIDEKLASLYTAERQAVGGIRAFALLAVFISAMGLFGLSAHAAMMRTKEMGIRKVLGASTGRILSLLTSDFLKLALIGGMIALPLGWYAMESWLGGFAYRIQSGWWFVGPLVLVLVALMAVATVGYHAFRTARVNPAHSLRSE